MKPLVRAATAALAVLVMAVPAAADHGVHLRSEDVFFHCATANKLANVDYLQSTTLPTWDTTAPSASVQSGAGCGWVDNSAFRSTQAGNSAHDGAWSGTFTGNLSSLTATVHSISAGPGRAGGTQTFRATLLVDGVSMFGLDDTGRANRADITLEPKISSTQLSSEYQFTITNLPFALEDGDGTKEREIVLNLAAGSEPLMGWVYDTTEVPSGLTFNPATPAAVKVRATP